MAPDPYLSNQGLIEETVQKDNQQFNKVDSAADNQAKESYITFLLGILLTDTKQLQQLLESHPSFESPHTKNTFERSCGAHRRRPWRWGGRRGF